MYNNTSKPYRLHFNLYKIAIQREGIYKRGNSDMKMKTKSLRCCLTDRELIEEYEQYKFQNDLNDRQIVTMALVQFLSQNDNDKSIKGKRGKQ